MQTTMISVLTPTSDAMAAVTRAVQLVGHEEPPIKRPAGALGGCVACGHTVASHFDEGQWLGCPEGQDGVVYVLVPATSVAAADGRRQTAAREVATAADRAVVPQKRKYGRARYFSTLHHKAKVEKLALSPMRAKLLAIIHEARKEGLVAADLEHKHKIPHGSISSTLDWLREHQLVKAREDGEE